jgi:DNA polymerase-3 subunit beta
MKIECSVDKIKNGILTAERVTGKNLTLPILSTILIIASNKTLRLRSTNLSLGVEVEIPAKIEKEGIVAVSGSVLSGVFANIFESGNVVLEAKDGNLSIKTKRNNLKVKGEAHDDFPTIPTVEGKSFEIEAKKIVDGIKSVYYSSSPSDIKPEISSVYIYTSDDNLVFVSTDSFRLAEKKIKARGIEEVKGILIPYKNIAEILRILGEADGNMKVAFNKNQISFSGQGVYLTSRVIDGIFPDYRQIIPKESKTEAVLLKQDLLNALKLSNIFSDKFNQVNLTIKPKEKIFELSSASANVGENKTHLEGALSGEAVELGFNYRYFLDCFQSITTDSLTVKLHGGASPMVITPVSDNSFTYLIMPMNK